MATPGVLLGSKNVVLEDVYINTALRHERQTVHEAQNLAPPPAHPRLFSQLSENDGRGHTLLSVKELPQKVPQISAPYDTSDLLATRAARASGDVSSPRWLHAWKFDNRTSRLMSPLSKDETGHGSSSLQRYSPISLIWLQWETAWLAALLLHVEHEFMTTSAFIRYTTVSNLQAMLLGTPVLVKLQAS